MRQFESIFLQKKTSDKVRAFVFTCEEELDFAGHPILGAAAVLHDLNPSAEEKAEWEFELNEKNVTVTTERKGNIFEAVMNQGMAFFGKTIKHRRISIHPGLHRLKCGRPVSGMSFQQSSLRAYLICSSPCKKTH